MVTLNDNEQVITVSDGPAGGGDGAERGSHNAPYMPTHSATAARPASVHNTVKLTALLSSAL